MKIIYRFYCIIYNLNILERHYYKEILSLKNIRILILNIISFFHEYQKFKSIHLL